VLKSYARNNTKTQNARASERSNYLPQDFGGMKIGFPSTLAEQSSNARRVAWVEHRSTSRKVDLSP